MNKSRWTWTLATSFVAGGLAIGSIAHLTLPRVDAQAPVLPATLDWVPAEASTVGHVDLQSVFTSPIGTDWEQRMRRHESFQVLDEIRKATGLDPESDLSAASFGITKSGSDGSREGRRERWGVAVSGTFDEARIISTLNRRAQLDEEDYQGTTIYRFQSAERGERALAFGDPSTLILGEPSYVREMLDAGLGRISSAGGQLMERWGESAFLGESFWLAGSPEDTFASALSASPGRRLPPLRAFSLSGRFDSELHLRGRGKASDAKSASELAEVVRGLVALGRLQQGASPEMTAVVDSIRIGQVGDEVEVSLAVPYEILRGLSESAVETQGEGEEQEQGKEQSLEQPPVSRD